MNQWHKYPFVRILTSFLAGILLAGQWYSHGREVQLWALLLVLVLMAAALYFHFRIKFTNRRFYGVLTMMILVILGFFWYGTYNSFRLKNHFSTKSVQNPVFIARFDETPLEKENTFKATLDVEYLLQQDSIPISTKGKILAYFEKQADLDDVKAGDAIVFESAVNPLEKVKNPNAFDYGAYLRKKGIFHRTYIRSGEFRVMESSTNGIYSVAEGLRQSLKQSLKSKELTPAAFSLVSALVLGDDQYLENGMRTWYSNAGIMHILCVSGLHVGILYVVFMFILGLMPLKSKVYNVTKIILVVLFIWLYALITGLEPAVMRASVMFSMVAFGKLVSRKTRIYNTLAASAFIMLLVNPNMIGWVGFQLSYLAVFGIVWLQPHIKNWWLPQNKFIAYLWELVAVSVAAQLVLFPLLIFYFHKVSMVFFITNLFAIPLATVLIYSTLLFFAFQWWNVLSEVLVEMLNFIATALNDITRVISALPGAYYDNIWIQNWQLLLIYASLFTVLTLLIINRKYIVPSFLIAAIALFIVVTGVEVRKNRNNSAVLYHLKNRLAMDFIYGDSTLFIADSAVISDEDLLGFHVSNTWHALYVTPKACSFEDLTHYTNECLTYQKPFLLFNDDIYFFLDKMPDVKPAKKIKVDYLVIRGKPWLDVEKALDIFHIRKKILISGSTPRWLADKWHDAFTEHHVAVHSTHRQGAFVINY